MEINITYLTSYFANNILSLKPEASILALDRENMSTFYGFKTYVRSLWTIMTNILWGSREISTVPIQSFIFFVVGHKTFCNAFLSQRKTVKTAVIFECFGSPLYPKMFYIIAQWSCSALWEMPDSNPGPPPQYCGAQTMRHHML